eukprot:c11190_g1_i1.p1 GENE.c11190_g1_i1~~c11190_g1_i1.p1  ORF type:complete len:306 (-),score=122.80 c11190_g1_i1:5-922(-)
MSLTPEMAKRLVDGIKSTHGQEIQAQKIRALFLSCNQNDSGHNGSLCAEHGAIDAIYRVIIEQLSPTQVKQEAFRALGSICFSNDKSSELVVTNSHFKIVKDFIEADPQACYLINIIAANFWESHPLLLDLVPRVLKLIKESESEAQKRWCVQFCGQLAYNKANKEYLLTTGVVNTMIEITSTGNTNLGCCTSSAALACLNDTSTQQSLEKAMTPDIIQILVACFASAVHEQDFPYGSRVYYTDWKIATAMDSLCDIESIRLLLIDNCIFDIIYWALDVSDSIKLKTYCFSILWKLCSETKMIIL